MERLAVDTNAFLYARGGPHPLREPCRGVVDAARRGLVLLEGSVEVAQELGHVLLRRGVPRLDALAEVDDVRGLCRLHAFDGSVLQRALTILRTVAHVGVRDAVHAATALEQGLPVIVSADGAFDHVADLERIDPSTWRPPD